MFPRRTAASFIALVLVLSTSAQAGKAGLPPRLRALYKSGHAHYSLGEYEKALTDFKSALFVKHEPAALFNIAQCYRQLGQAAEAARTYRSYLSESDGDPPNRAQVEKYIAEMDERVTAEERARQPPVVEAPPPAPPQEQPPVQGTPPPPPPWWKDGVGWALVAVGIVGVGVGIGLAVGALSIQSQADGADNLGDHVALNGQAQGMRVGGYAALGGGAALVVVGAVKLALHARAATKTAFGIDLSPGRAMATWNGSF